EGDPEPDPEESPAQMIADVRSYVQNSFGRTGWARKVRYEIERVDGTLNGVTATFRVPASDDEPAQVCAALSVYLYELRGASGDITVVDKGEVVFQREGPDGECEPVPKP
ncbi:MAG: hypothetical protein ACC660_08020, partial [Acidimicrobiales bacterium]